jgi:hypothetical protein
MDKVREGKVVDMGVQQAKTTNALFGLEHKPEQTEEERRAEKALLTQHLRLREEKKQDYDMNAALRKKFRLEKKDIETNGLMFGDSDTKVALAKLTKDDEVRTKVDLKDKAKGVLFACDPISLKKRERSEVLRTESIFGSGRSVVCVRTNTRTKNWYNCNRRY